MKELNYTSVVGKFLNGKMKDSVYGKAESLFPFPDSLLCWMFVIATRECGPEMVILWH